jgi:acyl carrier protein phosphodiesterase
MRFRAPIELGHATEELRRHYPALADDFSRFFPELQRHVESFSETANATAGLRQRSS